ncbi:hypothetical protein [Streptomyces sp. BE147]|uniref:hypothetical protein n=1 Tax=unclassified Streptomyces TaxID=2593676 RepID=UPI002E763D3F|nr:hypothetical protein [Streptomyces sp. BE147]MEE1739546.1 hypothetical protein [Streptomyces sp. BE147]
MPNEFRILDQYDAFEDPHLKSEFLDTIGTTRAHIEYLRRLRDAQAARNAAKAAEESESNESSTYEHRREPRPRCRRAPRRSRVTVNHPPNRGGTRRMPPRRRRRVVLVIVIELD